MTALIGELMTVVLVIGVIVTCTTLLVLILGHDTAEPSEQSQSSPRSVGPARPAALATTSSSAIEAARARARVAARSTDGLAAPTSDPGVGQHSTARPVQLPAPIALPPARQDRPDQDGRAARAERTVEEVRAVVDELIETRPEFLAEVITQWIHSDQKPTASNRRSSSRRANR